MSDYITKTVQAYDDVETYEKGTQALIPVPEIEQFLSYLPANPKVLDAGCAFGRDAAYLAKKNIDICGIDLSAALIQRAKELNPDLDFFVRDVRETGFEDQSFDGIWSNATLLHLNDEDIVKALKEFARILRTEGVVAFSLKKGEGEQDFVEKFSSNSLRYFNFKTRESVLPLIEEGGFKILDWHYMNERERYGPEKRDLDWLYVFARKSS